MFYDIFVQLCNKRGVKPSRVAIDLDLSKATATKWKNGSVPTGETLQKLADYFGVTVDYLLNEETKKSPAEAEDKITFDDFTYAMYNHSADLTEEEKKMLLEMAEFMKKKRGL